jgi:glutamine cyclotransferase
MRLVKIAALAALVVCAAVAARAADVSGKWTAEFDTPVGVQKYTFDLKADGDKLTGTAAFERMGQSGTAELKEGKLEGEKVSFVEMLDFQGNALRIEYTGTIAGDEIKFSRRVGDFGTEEFVAKRAK